jgi:predicted PurR-regulated permease PerM
VENCFWMPQRAALIFVAIVLAALLPFLLQIARPFLTPFLLASILAIVMSPAKNWLGLRIHSPAIATFFTTITTILLLGTAVLQMGADDLLA